MEGYSCFIFNFVAQSYKELLRKMVGLVSIFPESLLYLILYLPEGATNVDLYYATRI